MDVILVMIIIGCGILLASIPVLCLFILFELKKTRHELVKIVFAINQMKSSLAHQTLKIEMMNKHLTIIGLKAAPERYRKRSSVIK